MRLKITLFLFMITIGSYEAFAQCSGADFEEVNGIAILEMDSKVAGSWRRESPSGASGGSALTYRGSDSFGSPGNSTITYNVKINSPGIYRFVWRSKISIIASSNASSEHNDSWLKINAADFYGLRGSHRVYPGGSGKSPTAAGTTTGGWFKIYTGAVAWSWLTNTSDNDPHSVYANFSSAGVYSIQVSGRSQGHTIDRMVLYKTSSYSESQATSLSRSQTNCSGGSNPPPTDPVPPTPPTPPANNQAPTVNFSNLSNGQSFAAGSTVTVGLSASDSDGSIAKYQVYVNNSLVDSDGARYSPYQITGIQSGSYAIKATVTDNDGATATKTVNITVTGSTPTPTPPTPTPPTPTPPTPTPIPPTPTPPSPPTTSNAAPTVTFSNLTQGQKFTAGSTVSVQLLARDADGSVVKHQIFVNGSLVDTDGSRYTPHSLSNIAGGNYSIKATVTDDDGASATKTITIVVDGSTPTIPTPPVNPTPPPTPPSRDNAAPTVAFSTLTNGQRVAVGSTVNVGVKASDSDGNIVKHQIYINDQLVDTDPAYFTPHPIVGIKAGNYTIKVIVTDNDGATTSSTVKIVAGSGAPAPSSSNFTLVSASTNSSIGALSNGMSISVSKTQGVNIVANSPASTKSVVMRLSGKLNWSRTESVAPYALFGDTNGDYFSGDLPSGSYTLKATSYSGSGGSGSVIATETVQFTVTANALARAAIAYPNPIKSDGQVAITLPEGTTGEIKYLVTNTSGVQLEQGQFSADRSDVNLRLSTVGRQVQGVYYLTLISADSKQTIPLVRE